MDTENPPREELFVRNLKPADLSAIAGIDERSVGRRRDKR